MSELKKQGKDFLKSFLISSGAYHVGRFINRNKAIILMYHNFCKSVDEKHANVCIPIGDFEQHIKYLKRFYNIISLPDLVEAMRQKKPFPPNAVAITFDDGYKNNYSLAYPIIKKYNISVTIFLVSGYIGSGDYLWVNQLAYAINETQKKTLDISFNGKRFQYALGTPKEKKNSCADIKDKLKQLNAHELEKALMILYAELGFQQDKAGADTYQMLSWEDILAMRNGLVDFGSHTVTHSSLTSISDAQKLGEIDGSRDNLQKKLNTCVDYFCYPNGLYDNKIKEMVIRNYAAAVTIKSGFVTQGTDLYALPRFWTPAQLPDFIWNLVHPS